MNPTLVDFNNQTAVAQSWLSTVGYAVENTALDANANVLFYIQNKSVILPNGTVAGNLPNIQGNLCGQPGNLYTGILYAYNSEGSFEGIEAEVDKNNGHVIWVDFQGKVYSASVNMSQDNLLGYTIPKDRWAWGIEFDESEKGFYISTTQTSGGTTTGGVLHFPDLTDLSTNTTVSSSANYEKTFIEKAKDNNFYMVDKNGVLGKFTGNGPVSSAFNSLQVYSSISVFSAGNHYKLPDQIDGEDYNYFFGVGAYNLTGMSINSTPLVDVIPPPPPAFYNCNPIALTTT